MYSHSGLGRYESTGVPRGNPKRYESHGIIRMSRDATQPHKNQIDTLQEPTETEADRQLKLLVAKQLDTHASLQGYSLKKKEFTEPIVYEQIKTSGTKRLNEYEDLRGQVDREQELRHLGLTEEEITIKLEAEGHRQEAKDKKRRYGIDPLVRERQLKDIDQKISEKLEHLKRPDTFSGARYMSRQERDLEKAISHDEDKARLLGCLMTDQKPPSDYDDPNHPINHLDDMIADVLSRNKRKQRTCRISDDTDAKHDNITPSDDLQLRNCDDKYPDCVENRNSDSIIPSSTHGISQNNKSCSMSSEETVASSTGVQKGAPHQSRSAGVPRVVEMNVESVPEQDIIQNRLSMEGIQALPRIADYSPGEPSKTLFLKNLAPKVVEGDLVSLFIRFQSSAGKILFKLMTGRMKGQAFITFHDEETAAKALELVNGYQLKGKPIIIQYGKQR